MLTAAQIHRYDSDGFLVIDDFVSAEKCDALRERIAVLIADQYRSDPISIFDTDKEKHISDEYFLDSGDKIRFFFEKHAFANTSAPQASIDKLLNKVGHALHDLDPVFDGFSRQPQIASLVHDLGLGDPLIIQSMYIFKQPFIGGEVNPHQDGTFLFAEPDTLIGLWFALEDSTQENGCLWAIRGGHHGPLKSRFARKGQGTGFIDYDQTPWDTQNMEALEVKKGSVIVLHSRLPHMSHENRSSRSRHAYTLHFIDRTSDFPKDNWLRRSKTLPFCGFRHEGQAP